jgi:hypothetical protein
VPAGGRSRAATAPLAQPVGLAGALVPPAAW